MVLETMVCFSTDSTDSADSHSAVLVRSRAKGALRPLHTFTPCGHPWHVDVFHAIAARGLLCVLLRTSKVPEEGMLRALSDFSILLRRR